MIDERLAFLALTKVKGIGYWTLRRLMGQSRCADILDVPGLPEFNERFRQCDARFNLPDTTDWADWKHRTIRDGEWLANLLETNGVRIVFRGDRDFPKRLEGIDDPPDWLFIQGNLGPLTQRSVAIVGTRKPSHDGQYLTKAVCNALPWVRCVTVSGLATGIDQLTHSLSVEWSVPTIAVLGTGILSDYPAGSETVRDEIVRTGGTIITEYLPTQMVSAENFVRRNRLQAGLAHAVIPVEWSLGGGTAKTVRYALQQQRRLICVRCSHWSDRDHPELDFAVQHGAPVLTLPNDTSVLISKLRRITEATDG